VIVPIVLAYLVGGYFLFRGKVKPSTEPY